MKATVPLSVGQTLTGLVFNERMWVEMVGSEVANADGKHPVQSGQQ
jgi:hypothetical protein